MRETEARAASRECFEVGGRLDGGRDGRRSGRGGGGCMGGGGGGGGVMVG